MHEDPTRHMPADPPPGGPPPDGPGEPQGGMSGGAKTAIVLLAALAVGLGVALAVVASDDGGDEPESTTST